MKCELCQTEFTPYNRVQRFCSTTCTNRAKCQRFYKRNQKAQQQRVLKNYHKYKQNPEDYKRLRAINLKANSKRRFGVNRDEILNKYNNLCVFCGEQATLVHHLDRKGRRNPNPNNDSGNLVACCHSCHAKIHWHKQELQMKI